MDGQDSRSGTACVAKGTDALLASADDQRLVPRHSTHATVGLASHLALDVAQVVDHRLHHLWLARSLRLIEQQRQPPLRICHYLERELGGVP